ncbi:DUF221 domain protein, putative [Talaromyces stipitatus ATCC 10500]|uniref:DUF221 domain protein, putative n=1 Tax=Talaromyces stipitatus (strain ATCC 10500 / CBS 375.48 / QM 6759 / NRRL 1006) TaxID=441959 RepID=B8LSV8_TALSN|nr:DUF221 domain protein, putative [Talaromyces stipitatus ATCC 10500]EED22954.1 DUF221 domain protein, putative [Talaromyces stipitatus ATCC 10500]
MAWLSDGLPGLRSLTKRDDNTEGAPTSLSGFISTLVPSLIVAGVMILAFVVLRRWYRRYYMPRTFLPTLRDYERTPSSPLGLWNWITAMYKLPDTYVLQHHSLDAYLLLRYMKLLVVLCFVGCCITWPILFPINATGGGNKQQFDILSMSNVKNKARYFAHAFVGWIFFGFIFFLVTRESIFYINLRQAYAFSPAYANRLSSRTVMFSSVPRDYLDEKKLRRMFGTERVKNVWITTDTSKLEDKVKERDDAAMKLEAAETALVKQANAARLKALKKNAAASDEQLDSTADQTESGSVAARWVKRKDRPTHRLKFLIGKKVDTIDWARAEIERLNPEIEEEQAKHRAVDAKKVSAVFVEFYNQNDAQDAYQSVAHNQPLHMAPRYIGVDPTQVIWSNLRIMWWERVVRNFVTIGFICTLIVFWAIPVAFVGSISNIDSLIQKLPWLSFINDVPTFIRGVITGLLPSVLLSILMALLPIVIRLCAKFGGCPTAAAVELWTQNAYFGFQVVQVFLVTTLSSAASAVVERIIDRPTDAASLLAAHLPLSANFYVAYIVLQGLTFTSGALLGIAGLVIGKVLGKFLDKTPRKMYKRWMSLSDLSWGTVLPPMSLLGVIAIAYSIIAPLVMGFATVGLYLFYFAFRYQLLYVSNAQIDTQGRIYARALQHLLVGVYIGVVCLIGLFAIAAADQPIGTGPLVLMIIFLVFAVLYHVSLNSALGPLLNYLPKNLEAEEESLLTEARSKISPTASEGIDGPVESGSGKEHNGYHDSVDTAEKGDTTPHPSELPAPHKKPNLFTKFFRPDIYSDYRTMRRLVPSHIEVPEYPPEVERDAYFHPAITASIPLLWIPHDELGVSKQEVEHTSRVIPISDEDAFIDEKGNVQWNNETRPPIYEEKIYY